MAVFHQRFLAVALRAVADEDAGGFAVAVVILVVFAFGFDVGILHREIFDHTAGIAAKEDGAEFPAAFIHIKVTDGFAVAVEIAVEGIGGAAVGLRAAADGDPAVDREVEIVYQQKLLPA